MTPILRDLVLPLALLALGVALVLAACGQSPPATDAPAASEAPWLVQASPILVRSKTPGATATAIATPRATNAEVAAQSPSPSPSISPPSPVPAAATDVGPSPTPTQPPTAPPASPTAALTPPALPPVAPGLVRHGDRGRPLVALTFDACQSPERETGYDAALIRTLTETQTAATLFLGGLWVQSHPTQTQALAAVPYFELGNHSWSHPDFAELSAAAMANEITRTQEIIYRLTGQTPVLFRLPYGTYQPETLQVVAQLGLRAIQWDVVTGDPDPNISAEDIVRVVAARTQNGSIVIMHMNGRGWHTAEALPTIIDELSARGFRFVTVSELVAEAEGDEP